MEPTQPREAAKGKVRLFRLSPVCLATLTASFTFTVCYFRSFVFPDIPFLPWSDAVGFLNNGTRIVAGRLPYRDYFAFVPPSTDLAYALAIQAFGARAWIPSVMMPCLAALAALLMTCCAARIVRGTMMVLPGLLLVGFILPGSLDATHHWFSTDAVLAALLVLLGGGSLPRMAMAGALCGVAGSFTPTKGAMAVVGFIAYLSLKRWRGDMPAGDFWRRGSLLAGVSAAVFVAANAYFIRAAGLSRWLYCILVFPVRYYPSVPLNNWRIYGDGVLPLGPGTIPALFVNASVPLVYVMIVIATRRRWTNEPNQPWDQLLLIALTGLALFLAIAPSPSWKRLSIVSPPAMILWGWLLARSGRIITRLRVGLAVIALIFALAGPVRTQTRWRAYLNLPVGRTAFKEPARYDEYRFALGRTHPGELVFGTPPVQFALAVQNPAPIDVFVPADYTRPEQVAGTIQALEKYRVPLLMLHRDMYTPSSSNSASDHLGPLRAYLHQSYRLTKKFRERINP